MRMPLGSIPILAGLLLFPALVSAQQGVIVARATDAATARPLPLVQVRVTGPGTSLSQRAPENTARLTW